MQVRAGRLLASLGYLSALAAASEYILNGDGQRCNGMYSKEDWSGPVDPFILTKIDNSSYNGEGDQIVSFVIYEWRDEELLGRPAEQDDGLEFNYICDAQTVSQGQCTEEEIGQFLLAENASSISRSPIVTQAIHLKDSQPVNYEVKKTGYYCVWTYGFDGIQYDGTSEFHNAYGELPAAQIPKLPFYGGLTIGYALIGFAWAFLYFQNRYDILPVQNYITAILVFLVFEELVTWGYYDFQNRNGGHNLGTNALMVVTAVLNAARNSFSFFLLLIVCMGYGVVKPSLGKTMVYVRILALAHFLFGLIYGVGSLSITPDTVGPLVLLVIMPLAATLTAFYVWTLNSLGATLKDLVKRKQTVKALMYRRLWWCILGSIMIIFAFFFFNSFTFASRSDPDFVPNHWKSRWFVLDGWLNIVYLADICFIAYLWRPTANNRRFAMSDELTQDEDGNFEIASLGGISDDEDEEASPGNKPPNQQANGQIRRQGAGDNDDHDVPMSPVPPIPLAERHPGEEGEEGETLFAVGDEDVDKWSDDEDESKPSRKAG